MIQRRLCTLEAGHTRVVTGKGNAIWDAITNQPFLPWDSRTVSGATKAA